MRANYIAKIMVLFTMLLLGGCSSGGDDAVPPTPTPAGTEVDLTTFKGIYGGTAPQDTQMSFNLTGTDNDGDRWSGSITVVSDGSTTFESNNVTKSRVNITLTYIPTNISQTAIISYYFLEGTNELYKQIVNTGITATPVTQSMIPDYSYVGDFGELWNLSYSDGDTGTETWKIEPDYNGNSKFVISSTTKNSSDVVTSTEEDAFFLDSNGNPYRYEAVITWYDAGLTIELAGNRLK